MRNWVWRGRVGWGRDSWGRWCVHEHTHRQKDIHTNTWTYKHTHTDKTLARGRQGRKEGGDANISEEFTQPSFVLNYALNLLNSVLKVVDMLELIPRRMSTGTVMTWHWLKYSCHRHLIYIYPHFILSFPLSTCLFVWNISINVFENILLNID